MKISRPSHRKIVCSHTVSRAARTPDEIDLRIASYQTRLSTQVAVREIFTLPGILARSATTAAYISIGEAGHGPPRVFVVFHHYGRAAAR